MFSIIKRSVPVAVLMMAVATAHAAVPAAVSTAVGDAGTDGLAIVGLLAAAGAVCFILNKVLKKFGVSL